MNKSPLDLPADWALQTGWHGYARNKRATGYDVRISVGGRQVHVGVRHSQSEAARLYDLAAWKLCPKISRRVKPNDETFFSAITDELVQKEAPNLLEIYARLGFLNMDDGGKSEAELRARHLEQTGTAARTAEQDYDFAVASVQRGQVEVLELAQTLSRRTAKLGRAFRKLAGAPNMLRTALTELEQVARSLDMVQYSMKTQREYYLTTAKTKP
jgi:hypothetical protein